MNEHIIGDPKRSDIWYGDDWIAGFSGTFRGLDAKANAKLFIAAPKLLAALEELVDIIEDAIEGDNFSDIDSFTPQPSRAAIAEARDDD